MTQNATAPGLDLDPRALAAEVLERHTALDPDRRAELARDRVLREDLRFLIEHLRQALIVGDSEIFVGCVRWFCGRTRGCEGLVDGCLEHLRSLLGGHPSISAEVLDDLFSLAAEVLDERNGPLRGELTAEPLSELASEYLRLLLAGERARAARLIIDQVEQGLGLEELYLKVFQPVQWEVGRLWQRNEITVAHEHYCSAATQMIMAQLSPQLFSGEARGPRLVAAAAPSEQHEIGLRMIADLAEMRGWDTHYLGAATPIEDLIVFLRDARPQVLALTGSLELHVAELAEVIETLRAEPALAEIFVMVGGRPFRHRPGLARLIGADATAEDAATAVERAERWLEDRR